MNRILAVLLVTFLISCTTPYDKKDQSSSKEDKNQLDAEPKNVIELPKELEEISGLSFISENEFVAIEDETGVLYFYNIEQGKITEKRKFGAEDDYEDVVVAGKDIYVVKSNGTLYQIADFKSGNAKAVEYKTELKGDNNVEGLGYDAANNRLLLATKDSGIDEDKDDKDIYAFDLATKKLNTKAVFSLNIEVIEAYFEGDAIEEASKDFLKALGNKNMNDVFRSSALTIDEKTKNILVLSSINNIIAVLNPTGKIIKMIALKGKKFTQPEGLAFSPSGRLFVSNEGNGKKGNVIEIEYAN